jgi:hypothetical protein
LKKLALGLLGLLAAGRRWAAAGCTLLWLHLAVLAWEKPPNPKPFTKEASNIR